MSRARLEGEPALSPGGAATLPQLLRQTRGNPRSREVGLRFLDRRDRAALVAWSEVIVRAEALARRIAGTGVAAGDRVALFFHTEPAFFEAFFGCQLAGAVPVPLYPPLRLGQTEEYERRAARQLDAAEARLALASERVRRSLAGTLQRFRPALGVRTPKELETESAAELREVTEDDLALVQFSSGTTGSPKPVGLSHRALLYQARLLERLWPDVEGRAQSGVSWLPLYHDMGLIGCVLPALMRPADLTLLAPELFVARPVSWLRAISRYRATVSAAPNFAYALCVDRIRDDELEGLNLSCWSSALNGAESVAPRVLRRFAERFRERGLRPEALTPVYGLAEAALAVSFSELDEPFRSHPFDRLALAEGRAQPSSAASESVELASVGRPLPGFAIEVRDGAGRALAEGEVGEVWVRGPSLMEGYLGRPQATAAALVNGWLDTGDLGFVWKRELFLSGRAKDLLLLRGRKWSPEPVEQAVAAIPGLAAGAAVAVTHLPPAGDQEELWLLIERARSERPTRARVAGACRERVLAETGLLVSEVILLEPGALPRTSSGKLRRRAALTAYLLGRLAVSEEVAHSESDAPSAASSESGDSAPGEAAPAEAAHR